MNDLGKSCLMCSSFSFALGHPGYSDATPGDPGRVSCNIDKQQSLDDGADERQLREWVRFGNTCPDFTPAVEP